MTTNKQEVKEQNALCEPTVITLICTLQWENITVFILKIKQTKQKEDK